MSKSTLPTMRDELLVDLLNIAGDAAAEEERRITDLTNKIRETVSWQTGDDLMDAANGYATRFAEAAFWYGFEMARKPRKALIPR